MSEQVSVPLDQSLEGSTVSMEIQCVDLKVKIRQQLEFRNQSIASKELDAYSDRIKETRAIQIGIKWKRAKA